MSVQTKDRAGTRRRESKNSPVEGHFKSNT